MQSADIDRLIAKYAHVFAILEEYDRTHQLPFNRQRLEITLKPATIRLLKSLREDTGTPLSRLIEEAVLQHFGQARSDAKVDRSADVAARTAGQCRPERRSSVWKGDARSGRP